MKSELKKEKKKERNEKPSISEMKKISKEGSFSDKFKFLSFCRDLIESGRTLSMFFDTSKEVKSTLLPKFAIGFILTAMVGKQKSIKNRNQYFLEGGPGFSETNQDHLVIAFARNWGSPTELELMLAMRLERKERIGLNNAVGGRGMETK